MVQLFFDNSIFDISVVLLILIFTYIIWDYLSAPKNYPPGPKGVPIAGYLPFLGSKPHETLHELSKKYGDIFSLRLVNYRCIILTSYAAIQEALVKKADAFSDRPEWMMPVSMRNKAAISAANGEIWSIFRRFSLTTLRNFGFAKSSLEQKIVEEAEIMMEVIRAKKGQPFLLSDLIQQGITNMICTLMVGHRMEYDDPRFNELIKLGREQMETFGFGNIEEMLPSPLQELRIMEKLGFSSFWVPFRKMIRLFEDQVKEYAKQHTPGSQETFVDCWLTEIEQKGHEKPEVYNLSQIPYLFADLFVAGSDTTTNTINWAVLHMAKFPEIQKKVQNEIDDVIGRDRAPTMLDQKNMPFTDATLMEVFRIRTIAPLSVPHETSKDTTLGGYSIPKGTLVMPNIHAVHFDPKVFPEPEEFRPERFLNDKQQVKKSEQLIPFSMGKRQCMGESLARMELFLFFTLIMQHFTVKPVEGVPLNLDYLFALATIPIPQNLCLIAR